jgi:tight adherence protein C
MALVAYNLRGTLQDARLSRRLNTIAPSRSPVAQLEAKKRPMLEAALLCTGKDRIEVCAALRAAGYDADGVVLFAALRMGVTLASMVVVYFYCSSFNSVQGKAPFYAFMAGAATFIVSKVVLRSRATARLRRIAKEMPFFLDMLLLMLESGVSLDQCFRYLAQAEIDGMKLSRQAAIMLVDDLQKGMSYDSAFNRWSARLAVGGVQQLASLFKQSMLQGTPISETLHHFVREFSDRRLTDARASIGHKTTKLTVIMILFMMPALMIVLAGPAVVSIQHAFAGMNR